MIRKLQPKHTIRKLSSWLEAFEWTRLHFEVRCKMLTLKLAAKTSFCQISSLSKPSAAASPEVFFAVLIIHVWRFLIFSFIAKTARTIARLRLRSSPSKSIGFLAFVGPWPPARSESYRTLHFTRRYIATRTKNKAQKSTTLADQTKKYKAVRTAGGLERFSFECRKVIGFAFATLHDWLKKLAPIFHPFRSKTKTNRDLLARVFTRFASAPWSYFEFWLVQCIVCVLCDWLE